MNKLIVLVVVAVCSSAFAENVEVYLGNNGNILFGEPTEYKPTGIKVSSKAVDYPSSVLRLITEDIPFLAIKIEIVDVRMTGLTQWRVTEEAQLVLVRKGNILDVRKPVTDEERAVSIKDEKNRFGLFAAISVVMLIFGLSMGFGRNQFPFIASMIALVASLCAFVAIGHPETGLRAFILTLLAVVMSFVSLTPFKGGGETYWLGYRVSASLAILFLVSAVLTAIQ